jgi:hypothetical protein
MRFPFWQKADHSLIWSSRLLIAVLVLLGFALSACGPTKEQFERHSLPASGTAPQEEMGGGGMRGALADEAPVLSIPARGRLQR